MSFGMMEGAFFVGRSEILSWLAEFLKVSYAKIESTANGAAACQILDSIYPGKVALGKVNFNAKQEYEFINNYKVLQGAFQKANVDKIIPVDKLIKAKYQDNLEFMQWLKKFWDISYNTDSNYDAVARRQECGCAYTPEAAASGAKPPVAAPAAAPKPTKPRTTSGPAGTTAANTTTAAAVKPPVAAAPKPAPAKPLDVDRRVSIATTTSNPRPNVGPVASRGADRRTSILQPYPTDERVKEYQRQVAELKVNLDEAEKQREFYFHILMQIEDLCNQHSTNELAAQVLKKLAGDADEGENTAPVTNGGGVTADDLAADGLLNNDEF